MAVDSHKQNGYNINGGGINAISDERTISRDSAEFQNRQSNIGTYSKDERTRRENQSDFIRRTQSNEGKIGQRNRVLLKSGNAVLSYAEKDSDSSSGYTAVRMLKSAGVDAVYCDGDIETNQNGITVRHSEAVTTPDGKVFVSSNATLSSEHISYHENVHVNDRLGTEAYAEYESIICDNLIYNSKTFEDICTQINNNHYGDKYDVESTKSAGKFIREIAAYINEFVMTEPEFAERIFGGMFQNWNAVTQAVKQFNIDTKADFSEPAFLMYNNGDRNGTFTEPNKREIYTEPDTQESIDSLLGRNKSIVQRHLEKTALQLKGINGIVWDDKTSQGYYNPKTKKVHINPNATVTEGYSVLFGHEYVHNLEERKMYNNYKDYCFKDSTLFEQWVRDENNAIFEKLREVNFDINDFEEALKNTSREEAIDLLVSHIQEVYLKSSEFNHAVRESYKDIEKVKRELIAEFTAKCVFGNNDQARMEFLEDLYSKKRGVFERFAEFVKQLIDKLKGNPKNLTLVEDLKYLQKTIERVYNSKEKSSLDINNNNDVKYSIPNEYLSNVMSWANEANRSDGDTKIFNNNGKNYVFVVADGKGGYSELATGKYDEVKAKYERLYREENISIYEDIEIIRSPKGRNIYSMSLDEDGRNVAGSSESVREKELQNHTAGNTEHLRSGNKEVSNGIQINNDTVLKNRINDIKAEEKSPAFSIGAFDKPINVDTEKLTRKVIRQNRSSADGVSVQSDIESTVSAVKNKDWGGAMASAMRAAKKIVESSKNLDTISDDAVEVLSRIRQNEIRLDNVQKAEVLYLLIF